MFEQETKVAKQAKTKKSNIYKAVTQIAPMGAQLQPSIEHTDYVRAKTQAGAKKIVADARITVSLATQDDLLSLAKITALEGQDD